MVANLSKANTDLGLAVDNFIVSSIGGKSYNLDMLLASNKHVILNFSTTWSPSSWNHEKKQILSNIHNLYESRGQEVIVLFMEADLNTDLKCIKGEIDCNSSSMGDWTNLVEYPIVDLTAEDLEQLRKYKIEEYPSIYGISPNRKIVNLGQSDMDRIVNWVSGQSNYAVNVTPIKDFAIAMQYPRFDDTSVLTTEKTKPSTLKVIDDKTQKHYFKGVKHNALSFDIYYSPSLLDDLLVITNLYLSESSNPDMCNNICKAP
jgi:hypothetical protein